MEERSWELKKYWGDFLKWWWIFILGAGFSAVAALLYSMTLTPIYEAKTKVLVQGRQSIGAPTVGDIQASERLATSYSDLLKNRPILDLIIEDLSLPYSTATLFDKISVRSPRSLIEITVKDPNPQLAAEMADTTARIFIDDFQTRQLTQIAQFQSSLSAQGISVDPALIAAQAGTLSMLIIVEDASVPSLPVSPNIRLNVVAASLLGLLSAGLVVFGLEHLDDSIRTGQDLRNIMGVQPVGSELTGLSELGVIEDYRSNDGTIVALFDESHDLVRRMAESYMYVMLNLEFAALEAGNVETILITSALPSEGKTTNALNLSISLARTGKSVILVDADLRRPALHRALNLDNSVGLTNVVATDASIDEALITSQVENLKVILSGPIPPDPTILLRSSKMIGLIKELASRCDIVIFDSPPVLAASDPIVIAAMVDAVVLIVDSKHARRGSLQKAAQSLYQANHALLGAVLNKTNVSQQQGYGNYYYEYHDGPQSKRDSRIIRFLRHFRLRNAQNHKGGNGGRRRWNPARIFFRRNAKEK